MVNDKSKEGGGGPIFIEYAICSLAAEETIPAEGWNCELEPDHSFSLAIFL